MMNQRYESILGIYFYTDPTIDSKDMFLLFLFLLCTSNNFGKALRISFQPLTSPSTNSSRVSTTTPPPNRLSIRCDSHYGLNLDVLDCWNAIRQIDNSDTFITFEPRETMQPGDFKLPLPVRTMGSMYCAFHGRPYNLEKSTAHLSRRHGTLLCPARIETLNHIWQNVAQPNQDSSFPHSDGMLLVSWLWRHRHQRRSVSELQAIILRMHNLLI